MSRAFTLNHAQMMRRLYVRCHCVFHPRECSPASVLIRRFAVPQAVLLEHPNQCLRLRRDLLSVTRLLLLHILLAIHQPVLSNRPRLPSSSLSSSMPRPLLLSHCHYTGESDWVNNPRKYALPRQLSTRRF